jgi:hypothetical protein
VLAALVWLSRISDLTTVASTGIGHDLPGPAAGHGPGAAGHRASAAPPVQVITHALAHGWGVAFAAGAGFAVAALLARSR